MSDSSKERRRLAIATRGSALALWQANHVRRRLEATDTDIDVELVVIKTKGDKITDVPLAKIGGKALFVKEVEQALIDGVADLAVHSMKDVPSARELAEGMTIAAISEREDPADALCTRDGRGLEELPEGALVGTSSLRRQCQLRALRPDLRVANLRGNVPTRLGKLDAGDFDAIVLAAAGLVRLGYRDRISQRLDPEVCLPAVGQGALGIETRADDSSTIELVQTAIHHGKDAVRLVAERAFLAELEGGCQTPMAAYARYEGDELVLDALIGRPDGTDVLRTQRRGPAESAAEMGKAAALELIGRGAKTILEELIEAAAHG